MADDFSRNGPSSPDALAPGASSNSVLHSGAAKPRCQSKYDLNKWLESHGAPDTHPALDKVVALNSDGVSSIAAVGFCLGARYVFDLAFDNLIARSRSPPSRTRLCSIFLSASRLKCAASSEAPLLINTCPVDVQFPVESQAKADKMLADFAPGYRRKFFEGCTHGFAVRADLSDPEVKAGKEATFKATAECQFLEHL
ncbi:hypothetical protein C8R47DRAFT_1287307 [Mycena vitilis]|nr:hypothetical protein C8R47DRAFT_1287307 [Mycena vitilis]